MAINDSEETKMRAGELAPKPPLPVQAGLKAASYCLGAFAIFWFLRTGGAPELVAALGALIAAFGMGWYDCKLGWKPHDEALRDVTDQKSDN